jgi:hypothetical protein
MTIAQLRAIPLLVLGAGCFALAAIVDVPPEDVVGAAQPAIAAPQQASADDCAAVATGCVPVQQVAVRR